MQIVLIIITSIKVILFILFYRLPAFAQLITKDRANISSVVSLRIFGIRPDVRF